MANSPDASFSSPALLRSGKCIRPPKGQLIILYLLFSKSNVTIIWYFWFVLFPLWWTQLCAPFQLLLACFHCVWICLAVPKESKGWRPSPNSGKIFDQKLSLVLGNCKCQMDLTGWFLNDFCSFARYCKLSCSIHEYANVCNMV